MYGKRNYLAVISFLSNPLRFSPSHSNLTFSEHQSNPPFAITKRKKGEEGPSNQWWIDRKSYPIPTKNSAQLFLVLRFLSKLFRFALFSCFSPGEKEFKSKSIKRNGRKSSQSEGRRDRESDWTQKNNQFSLKKRRERNRRQQHRKMKHP